MLEPLRGGLPRPRLRVPWRRPRRLRRILTAAAVLAALVAHLWLAPHVEAVPSPLLLGAFVDDASGGGAGIQAGDRVILVFDSATNAPLLDASNIDTVLQLGSSHSWRDGDSQIGGATWTATAFTNDTLVITLSTSNGVPTVAVGDGLTIAPGAIQDVSATNTANPNVTLSGSFAGDQLIVNGVSVAPTFATVGTTGVILARLTLTAGSNSADLVSIGLTKAGTAADAAVALLRLFHDVNTDGAIDGGDVLLGSGVLSGGAATLPAALTVTAGVPAQLLVVADVAAGATPTDTVGISLAAVVDVTVAGPDLVRDLNFPVQSTLLTIAAPPPVLQTATANALGNGASGVQAGDQVILVFDSITNAPVLTASNVVTALPLNNGHSWQDGSGAIQSAVWSTTTVANDTLTITFSNTGAPPTVAVADVVSLGSLIADVSGSNAATGAPAVGGSFGVDTLSLTATDRAPSALTLGTAGVTLLQLTFSADFNQIVVTSIRVDRLGTAADGDTLAGGAKLYDDLDDDGVLDVGEPLLAAATFSAGSAVNAVAKAVNSGTPENLLVAVDTNVAGTPGNTLGVQVLNSTYVTVSAGDAVNPASFPVQSSLAVLAAPAPLLLSATATDNNTGQPGIQAGDTVVIVFDRATDAFAVTAANIASALQLNNGHTWLDGSGAITGAVWSTTTLANDTLTVNLSATSGAPTVAPGDTITIGAGTIRDVTSSNDAGGSPPSITGSFGADGLTVTFVDLAAASVARGATNAPFALLTLTAAPDAVVVTAIRIDRGGSATDADTPSSGVKVWQDGNGSGSLGGADTLLATGSFASGTTTLSLAQVVNAGAPVNLILSLDIAAGATLLSTIGLQLAASSYVTVGAGDLVQAVNFPMSTATPAIAAPAPALVGFIASDTSGSGQGIQAGDGVILSFDSGTSAFPITAANIDAVLALNNGHSWLDGAGAIGSAIWSTTSVANDTLTVTLSVTSGAPSLAIGDTVTIPPGTIRDVTVTLGATGSPPSLSGGFGADVLTVTPTDLAPAIVNKNTNGVVMVRLRLAATTNSVVVTALRIDRLGTATDAATAANGVEVYHDLDADGVLDSGEPLLGSGSFVGGTVTITTPLLVGVGVPQDVLIALDVVAEPGSTIGVALLNPSYVVVATSDAVANSNFGVLSSLTTIAGQAPQLSGAIASDDSGGGEGVQAGDTVAIVFTGPTNAHPIDSSTIDTVLALGGGHSWRDGSGAINLAVWSTSTFTSDTLTITLSANTAPPTVAVGDTITIAPGTIRDPTDTNNAVGSPPPVSGTFGTDTLTVTPTSLAPLSVQAGAGDIAMLQLTLAVNANSVTVSSLGLTLTGSAAPADFDAGGVLIFTDENGSGALDAGDLTLAMADVSGAAVAVTTDFTVAAGSPKTLLIAIRLRSDVAAGTTVAVEFTEAAAIGIGSVDVVNPAPFPIQSGTVTIVGDAPTLVAAVAADGSSEGAGVQTGDQIVLVFSSGTNGLPISAADVDGALQLSDGHSWLSGAGQLGSATWSTGAQPNDTLTIVFSAEGGRPRSSQVTRSRWRRGPSATPRSRSTPPAFPAPSWGRSVSAGARARTAPPPATAPPAPPP